VNTATNNARRGVCREARERCVCLLIKAVDGGELETCDALATTSAPPPPPNRTRPCVSTGDLPPPPPSSGEQAPELVPAVLSFDLYIRSTLNLYRRVCVGQAPLSHFSF
jgi:hypothetical protein